MADSTNNPMSSSSSADEPDGMLPAIQPVAATDENQAAPVSTSIQTVPAGQTMPDTHALVPMPEEAADNDLIEKEWVLKAKQIVEHTAEDPFSQAQELSKMKAEYLRKRYNKEIGTV